MTDRRVGLEAAPKDEDLVDWLSDKLEKADNELEEIVSTLADVMEYGKEEGEPYLFGYARLLNHLTSLNQPKLIRVLSAALWQLMENPKDE